MLHAKSKSQATAIFATADWWTVCYAEYIEGLWYVSIPNLLKIYQFAEMLQHTYMQEKENELKDNMRKMKEEEGSSCSCSWWIWYERVCDKVGNKINEKISCLGEMMSKLTINLPPLEGGTRLIAPREIQLLVILNWQNSQTIMLQLCTLSCLRS